MKRNLTAADRTFRGYADQHRYEAAFEPDWKAEFGRAFGTDPDFLASRGGSRAIVEVRGFNTRALTAFFGKHRRRGGAVPPHVTRRPVYYAIKEKAEQLAPFSCTETPLVIALANPHGADVVLDEHEMTAVMFGEVSFHMPVNSRGEGNLEASQNVAEAGYGVFRGTDSEGRPLNRWPHVSGVAVLGAFDRYAEFQRADLSQYVGSRDPGSRQEELNVVAEWRGTPVARREAPGPEGFDYTVTYFDLAGYELGSGPAVPDDWFAGPRDKRLGFDAAGISFGPTD